MPPLVESMAYQAEELPWHGLGKPVDPTISVEEMAVQAELDWPVEVVPLTYTDLDGRPKRFQRKFALVRQRDGERQELDIVGKRYVPVQNDEVLEFFREYVEAGEAVLETAGSLDEGRMVWALARLERTFKLAGKDEVHGYVLIANPHQYGRGVIIKLTTIRVVCWNTLNMALTTEGQSLKLWHNKPFDEVVRQEAKRRLGIARERFDAFQAVARSLAKLRLTEDVAEATLSQILGQSQPDFEDTGLTPTGTRIMALWQGEGRGALLASSAGTGWGLLNAVTQYVDHDYGRNSDNRLRHSWFGGGDVMKRRTTESLLQLVGMVDAVKAGGVVPNKLP